MWFGGNKVIGGTLTPGELTTFITYATQILMSLMMVSFLFVMLSRAMASGRRISEVLDEKVDITDPAPDARGKTPVTKGSVEFRNVSFRYYKGSDEKVLDNISLSIPAGKTVGIIGSTGCGKTTALMELERQGALVIDCDAVYHELLASNTAMLAEINARFPGTIENGVLQRKKLGAVVFADAAALDDLNAITHRYVRAEVRARLRAWARQGGTAAAIDAIALIESGLAELCTVTLGVTAPREVRIERLIAREGVTRAYAEARIDAQKPNEWFAKHCSYVLDNGGTLADFQRRCHQLIQEVLS